MSILQKAAIPGGFTSNLGTYAPFSFYSSPLEEVLVAMPHEGVSHPCRSWAVVAMACFRAGTRDVVADWRVGNPGVVVCCRAGTAVALVVRYDVRVVAPVDFANPSKGVAVEEYDVDVVRSDNQVALALRVLLVSYTPLREYTGCSSDTNHSDCSKDNRTRADPRRPVPEPVLPNSRLNLPLRHSQRAWQQE